MTPPATAKWLKISLPTLMSLVKSGDGPRLTRVGRNPRFAKSDLLEWIGQPQRSELPTFSTPAEIAAQLGMGSEWVRVQIKTGKLEAFKVGKQWRVTKEHLDAWASEWVTTE